MDPDVYEVTDLHVIEEWTRGLGWEYRSSET